MKKYLYILAAVLVTAGCGGKGSEDTETGMPAAPTGLYLHSSTETSLTFQWDRMDGAESYSWVLYRGTDTENSGAVKSRNVVIDNLRKATEYTFKVRSVSGNYASEASLITVKTEGEASPVNPVETPSFSGEYADFLIPAIEDEDGTPRAFPGAEGGGMYTTGGRGGKVLHVTNLNDSGAGSLRWACTQNYPRTIVFDVAGIIELQSQLQVNRNDCTIAGQTAPGDGICLKNYTFRISASNVIVRYIRCRMGDEKKTEDDAMQVMSHDDNKYSNIIIDHCSVSWSTDECASFYGMKDFTFSWNIVSESLRVSVHEKGTHGYGGIWGGNNASYHHNLLAHHDSRNPRLDHDYVSTQKGPVSLVNNVVYNWSGNTTYGGESANTTNTYRAYNVVNNYYKPGPASQASKNIWFIDPWTSCSNCTSAMGTDKVVPGQFYMDGNIMDGYSSMTADNWTSVRYADVVSKVKAGTPFSTASPMSIQSAADAFVAVCNYAGASVRRDEIDTRIAKETRAGNYTYTGSNGSKNGLIDTQKDVGGWPSYSATGDETALVSDTDGDGIPDWFEDACKLDKDKAADGAAKTLDAKGRYTNLEMYLHYLVREITRDQNTDGTYTKL